jgi:hypothetical protein
MNEPGCLRVIRTPPGRITETIYRDDFLQQFDNKQTNNSMSFSLPANPWADAGEARPPRHSRFYRRFYEFQQGLFVINGKRPQKPLRTGRKRSKDAENKAAPPRYTSAAVP